MTSSNDRETLKIYLKGGVEVGGSGTREGLVSVETRPQALHLHRAFGEVA